MTPLAQPLTIRGQWRAARFRRRRSASGNLCSSAGFNEWSSDFTADSGSPLHETRDRLTDRQIVNVDALKAASDEFTMMRRMAMRFRRLLRGGTAERLDIWLHDARKSGIYGLRRFSRAIRQDIEAVRNAVLEPWSNGQTEGQVNKLKTLKRAMYGRAGIDLLRPRMLPLNAQSLHRE